MITKSTVDHIIETARVDEVVGDFVTLKKRGANLMGLCPFHNEKTPSFTVSPAKGIYKCFGCGKAGNSVGFVMEHEHFSFPEALRYLAEKYNITIEEEFSKEDNLLEKNEKESLFIVSAFAQEFYTDYLFNSEEGKSTGLTYFEERGFSEKTIKKFQLGFAPNAWNSLTTAAVEKGYLPEYLQKAGITIIDEDREYDRFRNRVIFPIHNLTGRVIAFGGRILQKDPKLAKYINSPETEIYYKSKSLYGIFFAKKAIIEKDECYLVEGYTDVISLHQEGIENVVASSGTSLTVEQIRLIGRYTKNVTVLYDGDAAGIKASLRGIDLILEEGLNVKVVLFPDGDDPDSFARKHSHSELTAYLKNNAQDFIRFKTSLLLSEVANDPVRRSGLIKDVVETISKIPDFILRESYIKLCAELMDASEQTLIFELNKILTKKNYKRNLEEEEEQIKQDTINVKQDVVEELNNYWYEAEIIRILLQYGNEFFYINLPDSSNKEERVKYKVMNFILEDLTADEIKFEDPIFSDIFGIFNSWLSSNTGYNQNFFINHDRSEIKETVLNILSVHYVLHDWGSKHIIVKTEEIQLDRLIIGKIHWLKIKKIQSMIEGYLHEIKTEHAEGKDVDELMGKVKILLGIKKELAKYPGVVVVK